MIWNSVCRDERTQDTHLTRAGVLRHDKPENAYNTAKNTSFDRQNILKEHATFLSLRHAANY
jgi:hypothetical protein